MKQECENILLKNGEIIASCCREAGHKGRHEAMFNDGTNIKWVKVI